MAGTDKIREEFEAWALANPDMTRATHGDVWRGVFETVAVELPPLPAESVMTEEAYLAVSEMRDACAKAIENEGLQARR